MAFMIPEAQELLASEAQEYTGDDNATAGWYGRLSAPGYLDCTDWSGPFSLAWQALRATCEEYDVRTDGELRL